ncbi:MAG: cytoplasmic protein, partial [Calditrichia bacterium]|nr:cytoplasmic protein [Calditrichia bacterium]
GVMGGNRGSLHNKFTQKINDISAHILPTLTIIDAYRILLRNGPSGGNINDVKIEKALIMSPCTVTADYLALNLFDLTVSEVPYIQEAIDRGLNKYDINNLDVIKINLS